MKAMCLQAEDIYYREYPWYPCPPALHKLFRHTPDIMKAMGHIPLGICSEESLEARIKDIRYIREHSTRKCSWEKSNQGRTLHHFGRYENLEKNIIEMIGKRALLIAWYWKWTWRVLAPLVTAGTLVFSFVTFGRTSYRDYQYNWWAEMIGWVVTFSSIGMVPFFALQSYLRARRRGQNVMMLLRPTAQWGSGILEMIKSADDLESKNKLSFHNRVVDLIAKPDEQQTSAF
ncbi:unnamed protein product [Cyprideis torosa]|uniref:Uncharacterized protein n=1 Tax=Cyprideis torosa TaxID=163714 RepID=A0A7R8WL92_9CRUS|nr:unnamed protein product [Cyprideis torosa]CAG0897751.1 unnamed protein product [Cyprideis torosa]